MLEWIMSENYEFQIGTDLTWCPTWVFCEFAMSHDLGFSGAAELWVFYRSFGVRPEIFVCPTRVLLGTDLRTPIKNATFQFFSTIFLYFPFLTFYDVSKVIGTFLHRLDVVYSSNSLTGENLAVPLCILQLPTTMTLLVCSFQLPT